MNLLVNVKNRNEFKVCWTGFAGCFVGCLCLTLRSESDDRGLVSQTLPAVVQCGNVELTLHLLTWVGNRLNDLRK
ncbi:MAG: hypothetical protein ACTS4U_00010 [Candidatus Hodgkinia cicadicola]